MIKSRSNMNVSDDRQELKRIYTIFSVDTEHDIISKYTTKTAGWVIGIPLLLQVFNALGMSGKVCWLIEYNLKDGIIASNPRSQFFVQEFPELIMQIKNRGDELGLHPTMYDWLAGERNIPASSYNNPELWDFTKRCHNPEFVMNLVTSASKEFQNILHISPVGCRTGAFQYATHLATALDNNRIHIDSSVSKNTLRQVVAAPNAYYAARDDIRKQTSQKRGVLEIPTTGYICNGLPNVLLKLRTLYLLDRYKRQVIFLSFFIHNWQAVNTDGKADQRFLNNLSAFLQLLNNHGATFLSWTEAIATYNKCFLKDTDNY